MWERKLNIQVPFLRQKLPMKQKCWVWKVNKFGSVLEEVNFAVSFPKHYPSLLLNETHVFHFSPKWTTCFKRVNKLCINIWSEIQMFRSSPKRNTAVLISGRGGSVWLLMSFDEVVLWLSCLLSIFVSRSDVEIGVHEQFSHTTASCVVYRVTCSNSLIISSEGSLVWDSCQEVQVQFRV